MHSRYPWTVRENCHSPSERKSHTGSKEFMLDLSRRVTPLLGVPKGKMKWARVEVGRTLGHPTCHEVDKRSAAVSGGVEGRFSQECQRGLGADEQKKESTGGGKNRQNRCNRERKSDQTRAR